MTNLSGSNPRIYVACLAAYNNGYLYGAWIDADQNADEIREEIAAMLGRSPIEHAEEYAIHDYEGFEGVTISEYAGIDTLARLGAFIAEHGALGAVSGACRPPCD
ncbi:antirestriction protein ArdA [Sphingopyxis yananensis]|uniref:antirestriction protein ArdA n=1 Tax=Sphingopyxis yananensis TaxID=2886687 RepID=UPI001D1158CF|nr:antirestriction protein ArdA [Sphingopyxis yananensis]MCC2603641.1 antirestriction protein ArdA [Sphingopyxis yananensis]